MPNDLLSIASGLAIVSMFVAWVTLYLFRKVGLSGNIGSSIAVLSMPVASATALVIYILGGSRTVCSIVNPTIYLAMVGIGYALAVRKKKVSNNS